MQPRLRNLLYGTGMAAGALMLAWLVSIAFLRSWAGISLFLLAMLIIILLQQMVAGGIPNESRSGSQRGDTSDSHPPSIREETAHLKGADTDYGWMALPAALALAGILISTFI